MGQTRRKGSRNTDKRQEKRNKSFCYIPIRRPVTKFLSSEKDANFYEYVNNEWISTVKMPMFENDFSVSEEVERCVYKKSVEILNHLDESSPMKTLRDSCLINRIQPRNIEYLTSILRSIQCIDSPKKVIKHFAALCQSRIPSLFNYQYKISSNGEVNLLIDSGSCGLPISYYSQPDKMAVYKKFLDTVGDYFEINELSQIYEFEKTLVQKSEEYYSDNDYEIMGGKLPSKFPGIPWDSWFENSGLIGWKSIKIFYNSPRWFRYIGKALNNVSFGFWKLYLSRIYILHALPYLPPPYDDLDFQFFGVFLNGQKEKIPQMELYVNLVYKFFPDTFSELFWEKAGNPHLLEEMKEFTQSLVKAAKKRVLNAEWLQKFTRIAAIEKINKMKIKTVRPEKWEKVIEIKLESKNLLKNLYDLGNWNTNIMFSRLGKRSKFWSEGIYRVNAYYFNENNEIIIPYATIIPPFYSQEKSAAWNYGALGSIIGHEMCHGFDEDGKEYSETGEKKRWWTRADNSAYKKKSLQLIKLFEKETVHGKHIHGDYTLSENIADLGGLGISLEALKNSQKIREISGENVLKEFREFFIAYATSWRTKYRKEKLENMLETDRHAPAFLRVNLVVSQMQEWYDAFDIKEDCPMYIRPENRISIF